MFFNRTLSGPLLSGVSKGKIRLNEYPRRAKRGIVVCRCDRPQRLTERVTAVPWAEL